MKIPTVIMTNHTDPFLCLARAGASTLMLLCAALAFTGCSKPVAKAPEKSLVRTVLVQPLNHVRSDGNASYLAIVKFDNETDLNFKVGGIVVNIGPGTGWDEG